MFAVLPLALVVRCAVTAVVDVIKNKHHALPDPTRANNRRHLTKAQAEAIPSVKMEKLMERFRTAHAGFKGTQTEEMQPRDKRDRKERQMQQQQQQQQAAQQAEAGNNAAAAGSLNTLAVPNGNPHPTVNTTSTTNNTLNTGRTAASFTHRSQRSGNSSSRDR